jgi:hypothetical protein
VERKVSNPEVRVSNAFQGFARATGEIRADNAVSWSFPFLAEVSNASQVPDFKGFLGPDLDPADGDTSFVMTVKHSNRFGRAYKKAGSATLAVDAKTRVNRRGAHNLGALAPNDRLLVTAKVCRADLKNDAMPDLTARRVLAHPAKAAQS